MMDVTSTRRARLRHAVLSCLLNSIECSAGKRDDTEATGCTASACREPMTDAEFTHIVQDLYRDGLCWNANIATQPARWTLTVAGRRVARRRRRMGALPSARGNLATPPPTVPAAATFGGRRAWSHVAATT